MHINNILKRTKNKLNSLSESVFKLVSDSYFKFSGQREELELTKENLIFWLKVTSDKVSKRNFQKFDSENNLIIYFDKINMLNKRTKPDYYYSYQIKFKGSEISLNAEFQRELFLFDTEEKKYKSKGIETLINTNNRREFIDGFKDTRILFMRYVNFNINKLGKE